jgi:NADP-dependent 3-hydroxy acid dehydrogenase YdfG
MKTLEGQVAWITGAGSGIGEAGAQALALDGAHVVLSGRRAGELERVADAIRASGGKAEVQALDVTDAAAVQSTADAILEQHGRIDILVANAGINVPNRAFAAITATDFARIVDINLNGVMYGVLAVLPAMRKAGQGTLILTSSWAGRHVSRLTGPAYSSSKHAVVALSHSVNQENAEHGIRCTALMPGEVATPIMNARPVPPSAQDQAKMLQPEDLGSIIHYIAAAPARVCLNEVLISPTHNRAFTGVAEAGGVKL